MVVHRVLSMNGFLKEEADIFYTYAATTRVQILGLEDATMIALLRQQVDEELLIESLTALNLDLSMTSMVPEAVEASPIDIRASQLSDKLREAGNEEVMEDLAASPYGQQVSLFSQHPERMGHCIDQLVNQVCRVNLNASCQRGPDALPFTGRKDSAVSTLSVRAALRSFSIRTIVACPKGEQPLLEEIVGGRHSAFTSMDYLL